MHAQKLVDAVEMHVRARYPILYLVTHEESRAEDLVRAVAERLKKRVFTWTATRGLVASDGVPGAAAGAGGGSGADGAVEALRRVADSTERALFVFEDLHPYLKEPQVVRTLRDLARDLRRSYKTLILVSPLLELPPELEKDVHVLDVPLPGEADLGEILDAVLRGVKDDARVRVDLTPGLRERVLQAALGLTAGEAENIFCKAIVTGFRFDESDLDLILTEKRQIIRKSRTLEAIDLDETLSEVGGLDRLKEWLAGRAECVSERARAFGLPEPRGLLLLGVQGCGKSLKAKAIAGQWKLPLLRLDVGSLFGPYIGTSEENMRRAIQTAESLSPCILWLDEIEKGFGGIAGSGSGDSGTALRVFATFLTWIQEKTRPVFVVATANSIQGLPAEMLRKGRFDEIFFVDLPSEAARRQVLAIHLRRRGRDPARFAVDRHAVASEGMSGAELEQVVVSALYRAFAAGARDLEDEDLDHAIRETVPLSVTLSEAIDGLREWARKRARPAD